MSSISILPEDNKLYKYSGAIVSPTLGISINARHGLLSLNSSSRPSHMIVLVLLLQVLQQEGEKKGVIPPCFAAHSEVKFKEGVVRKVIPKGVITHPLKEETRKLSPMTNFICLRFRSRRLTWLSTWI